MKETKLHRKKIESCTEKPTLIWMQWSVRFRIIYQIDLIFHSSIKPIRFFFFIFCCRLMSPPLTNAHCDVWCFFSFLFWVNSALKDYEKCNLGLCEIYYCYRNIYNICALFSIILEHYRQGVFQKKKCQVDFKYDIVIKNNCI